MITPSLGWLNTALGRIAPDDITLASGLWWAGTGGDVVMVDPDLRVLRLTRTALCAVVQRTITPARGQGGFYIALRVDVHGHRRDLPLFAAAFDDRRGPDLAMRIAQALALSVVRETWPDD